ncbi:MAG: ABC transporter substrate-binding protein, partial [Planctomycetota bacterium]
MNPRRLLFVILAALTTLAIVPSYASAEETVLQLPIRTDGPKSLDPVQGSTTYDNMACVQMYETLLVNQYADPFKIEPLLLAEMPTTQDEGKTWRFRLKPDVKFHDNPCFEGGVGRTVTTDDVFYSIKRVVDKNNGLKNVWLLENTILGFDEYAEKQNASESFDYDAPVAGFRKINDLEFEIELTKPVYRFLYILS